MSIRGWLSGEGGACCGVVRKNHWNYRTKSEHYGSCMENRETYGRVVTLPKHTAPSGSGVASALLVSPQVLTDIHPVGLGDPAGMGFILAQLTQNGAPVLWVHDHASRRENGRPYMPGIRAFGVRAPVLQVRVSHPRDVLWALEEGASCGGLSAIVGEIHGAPQVLDFTATKRLALRGEASGVPIYLIRSGDGGVLSAARERWRVSSRPSAAHRHDPHAPGGIRWQAELFRARGRAPGRWLASYEAGRASLTDRLDLVSATDVGTLDAGNTRSEKPARG